MIDLHCHILPGIDDGAGDHEAALAMVRMAEANGITHMVATPHIWPGRYDNTAKTIREVLDSLRSEVTNAGVKVHLAAAAEVRLSPDILPLVEQGEIPCFRNRDDEQFMLLELPPDGVPLGSDKLVSWLIQRDIRPVIAHPERNKAIIADPSRLNPFLRLGCPVQITAGSVAGRFGKRVQASAQQMLRQGVVFLMASDAHNVQRRCPDLGPGIAAATEIIGEAAAMQLVTENPMAVAGNLFS